MLHGHWKDEESDELQDALEEQAACAEADEWEDHTQDHWEEEAQDTSQSLPSSGPMFVRDADGKGGRVIHIGCVGLPLRLPSTLPVLSRTAKSRGGVLLRGGVPVGFKTASEKAKPIPQLVPVKMSVAPGFMKGMLKGLSKGVARAAANKEVLKGKGKSTNPIKVVLGQKSAASASSSTDPSTLGVVKAAEQATAAALQAAERATACALTAVALQEPPMTFLANWCPAPDCVRECKLHTAEPVTVPISLFAKIAKQEREKFCVDKPNPLSTCPRPSLPCRT